MTVEAACGLGLSCAGLWCCAAAWRTTRAGTLAGTFSRGQRRCRLEAETVQAVAARRLRRVPGGLRFVNEGAQQTVDLGFPYRRYDTRGRLGTAPLASRQAG